jgi:thiol-disulfide isomerase/thioredoxin
MDDLYNKARNVYELTPDDFNIKSLKGRVQMKKFLGSDGFIVFYAPWCPHCHNPEFVSTIKKLGDDMKDMNIRMTAYNCTKIGNEDFSRFIGIEGFPSIYYFNHNGHLKEYVGMRNREALLGKLISERKNLK